MAPTHLRPASFLASALPVPCLARYSLLPVLVNLLLLPLCYLHHPVPLSLLVPSSSRDSCPTRASSSLCLVQQPSSCGQSVLTRRGVIDASRERSAADRNRYCLLGIQSLTHRQPHTDLPPPPPRVTATCWDPLGPPPHSRLGRAGIVAAAPLARQL